MALTTEDLKQIRGVMDEAIAEHPRFDAMKAEIIDEVSDVIKDSMNMIDARFDRIEGRLDKIEHRFDTLRIESNA